MNLLPWNYNAEKHNNEMLSEHLKNTESDRNFNEEEEDMTETIEDNIFRIECWADKVGIYRKWNQYIQLLKLHEELEELTKSKLKDDIEGIEDAIGDIFIALVNLSRMENIDIIRVIDKTTQIVTSRTGKVNDKGVFIKD